MNEFQSNRAFPISNSSLRQPLVRYGILPIMSPQESRTLLCFLEGGSKPYDVFDIPIGASVFRLKAMIKERIKRLHDIDPDDLKLRKVSSLILMACTF